jgi:hypothetical protein
MTHVQIIHGLAIVLLICAVGLFVIDAAEELGSEWALRIKWTLGWTLLRYTGIISGVLLALDVLF